MKWFYHSATVVTACSSEDNCLWKTIFVTARQGSNPFGPALADPKFPQSGCKGTENLPNCQIISPFFDDFSSRKLQKRCLKGSQKYAEKIKSCFKLSELSFLIRWCFFEDNKDNSWQRFVIPKECEKDEKHENSIMGKDIEDEPPVAPMELLPR